MNHIKEGDLYKIIDLYGTKFEIRYGYYDEKDRHSKYSELIPIFPDLYKNPKYTKEGFMFVAIKGFTVDGHEYIENAINAGAVAVVVQEGCDMELIKKLD